MWRTKDGLFAAGVAVASLAFTTGVASVVAVALSAPLAIRRTHPKTTLAVGTGAAVAHAIVLNSLTVAVVTVPVLVYTFARWEQKLAHVAFAIALVGAVAGPLLWLAGRPVEHAVTPIGSYVAVAVAAFAAGRSAKEKALVMERAARAEERAEIAREVHDVVAHSLAMIAVQAEGGSAKPEKAPEVLDTIADESRKALNEIRDLVGVLRKVPNIRDLTARLGDRVTLHIGHETASITVYRVVQESLTNFLKHAGPQAKAEVTISQRSGQLDVMIKDNGCGRTATDGRGNGLAAMRERVESQGGTLTTTATDEGFEVRATLPLREMA